MQGSFDHPPIIVRQDADGLVWLLIGCLVFVGAAVFLFFDGSAWAAWHGRWGAGIGGAFFAACAIAVVLKMAFPASLTLEPAGLTVYTGFQTWRYEWADFGSFYVFSRGLTQMPGCHFSQHFMSKLRYRRMIPSFGALPGNLELDAAAAADLLNEALQRWGSTVPLSDQK